MAKMKLDVKQFPHAGEGFLWKSRSRKGPGSQTAGKTKTKQCKASPEERYFAGNPKACKTKGYQTWFDNAKRINKVK